MTTTPSRPRVNLPDVSSRAWEHPADRGALIALRKLKGFDTALKALSGFLNERRIRLIYLGSAVRVDERQFPELHRMLADVGQVLDVDELPELYVANNPFCNAMTIGIDTPIIVVNSGLLNLMDDDETRFVIGHELGHALSGHAVYRTLLIWLGNLTGLWSAIPGGALGLRVIVAALNEWQRKSELSCDRAGLLATQDPAVAFRAHMKMASGSGDLSSLDATSFFEQGSEYTETTDIRDSMIKLAMLERATHPFAVVRAAELRRWVDSGEYTRILGGEYPRRTDDADASVTDAAREAADGYTESFRTTGDAFGKLIGDVAGFVGSAATWIDERVRRRGGPD